MTREEHILVILMEECDELSQRVSKALRFGLDEIQPGQELTNKERMVYEFNDLLAAFDMIIHLDDATLISKIIRKKEKIEKFLDYSKECGTLH